MDKIMKGKKEKKERLSQKQLDNLKKAKSSPALHLLKEEEEEVTPEEVELRAGKPILHKGWSSYPSLDVYQSEKKKTIEKKEMIPARPLTPEGTRKNESAVKSKGIDLDPSSWQFHCTRVWSKALKSLPVAIDLPRLAPTTTIVDYLHPEGYSFSNKNREYVEAIYDYTSSNSIMSSGDVDLSFKKHDLFILLEQTTSNWLRVQFNGVTGVVPSSYVKIVASPPVTKDKRTLDVLATLVSLLESESKSQKVQQLYYKYIPKTIDSTDRDISRELNRFFDEVLEEDSPTVRVLKACNQAIIAPAVIELNLNVSKRVPFKDGLGWRIRIMSKENEVSVTHWKRQKHVAKPPEPELFDYFEWELSLSFDKRVERILSYSFNLSEIVFNHHATYEQRLEITRILSEYFEAHGGTRIATPPASFTEEEIKSVSLDNNAI